MWVNTDSTEVAVIRKKHSSGGQPVETVVARGLMGGGVVGGGRWLGRDRKRESGAFLVVTA